MKKKVIMKGVWYCSQIQMVRFHSHQSWSNIYTIPYFRPHGNSAIDDTEWTKCDFRLTSGDYNV